MLAVIVAASLPAYTPVAFAPSLVARPTVSAPIVMTADDHVGRRRAMTDLFLTAAAVPLFLGGARACDMLCDYFRQFFKSTRPCT